MLHFLFGSLCLCVSVVRSTNQFADWPGIVEQILRPAVVIGQRDFQRYAQRVVNGGDDVLEADGAAARAFSPGIGIADDLAHAQAAAEEDGAAGVGPVLAAGTGLADP